MQTLERSPAHAHVHHHATTRAPARSRAGRVARTLAFIAVAIGALVAPTMPAWAQAAAATPLIYPAKGQSAQQQDRDKYECHDWARTQSGFDPTKPVAAPAPVPAASAANANANSGKTSSAGTAAGMATGAMGAAAVAQLTHHDPARAAAAGALGGGVVQRVKQQQQQAKSQQRSDAEQQQQQALAQQAARLQQQRTTYDRATAACMEGRGYTVK